MPEFLGYQFDRVYPGAIERYRQVSTIAERDAIPTLKRWEGMLCYVTGETKDYQLRGGTSNLDWEEVAIGGGSLFDININDSDDITEGVTNLFLTPAQDQKLDYITVTQAVDLDQLETDVAALSSGVTFVDEWDASSGSFPGGGTAAIGDLYVVTTAGTVDSVSFAVGDGVIAVATNASTTTYASNWIKTESQSDVTSVAGLTGAVGITELLAALNVESGATADQTGAEIQALLTAELGSSEWETQLTSENVMDIVGAAIGDQTNITVTYDDANNEIDFSVDPFIVIYATLAAAISDQASQTTTQLYEITDGSGFTSVTSGKAWVRYLGTTNGDETDYTIVSKAETTTVPAPIPLTYTNTTTLFAGQGNQTTNYIYEVTDGSGFAEVVSGVAWVKYLGTTNGDATDYIVVNAENLITYESFTVVCSAFETDLAVDTYVGWFSLPYNFTFTEVIGDVRVAPTGSSVIADVNVDGTTIMSTNKAEIEVSETSTSTATTQPTITDATHTKGQIVSCDIDQIGSTIAGQELIITLVGYKS